MKNSDHIDLVLNLHVQALKGKMLVPSTNVADDHSYIRPPMRACRMMI